VFVQDNILMPIRGEGLVDGDGEGEDDAQGGEGSSRRREEKVVYVLHPNCAVEEL